MDEAKNMQNSNMGFIQKAIIKNQKAQLTEPDVD